MSPLGPLTDEPPEPMKRVDFERVQTRVKAAWNGDIVIDRADVKLMLDEIRWLKRRLLRVEDVLDPIADVIRQFTRR